MVSTEELRGFIRQALSHGEGFDKAMERCFGGAGPAHASEAEQEDFRAAAEQLWKREAEAFNPDADAAIAPLRDLVLALTMRIADWIRSLDRRGLDPSELPAEPMMRLSEMSGMLTGVIEVLNGTDESDPEEIRRLHETVGRLAPVIDRTIAEAEAGVSGGEQPQPHITRPPEPESVFVLTVRLKGIKPSIWRRVRVPGSYTLGDLHVVVQTIMDWDGDHLHEFVVNGRRYADPMDMEDPDILDEEEVTLDELGLAASARFEYTYDFGDGWKHEIKVHRVVSAEAFPLNERVAVVCVAGKRAAPPDDCGGVAGYMWLLDLLDRPKESLSEIDLERVEHFGYEFEPEEFDIDRVNAILHGEPQW